MATIELLREPSYAAVNRHLELTLLKSRQRFDATSALYLEVCKFRSK